MPRAKTTRITSLLRGSIALSGDAASVSAGLASSSPLGTPMGSCSCVGETTVVAASSTEDGAATSACTQQVNTRTAQPTII